MSNLLLNYYSSKNEPNTKTKNYYKIKSRPKKRNKLNISSIPFFPKKNEHNKKNNIKEENLEKKENTILKINQEQINDDNNNNKKENNNNDNNNIDINIYSYEYIRNFKNKEKSKETDLLSLDILEHINQMEEDIKLTKMEHYLDNNTYYSNCNTSKSSSSSLSNINTISSLEQWARPDYTEENKEAEKNKKDFDELSKKDIIKQELTEILNVMTKDNYEEMKLKILEIIKEKIEYQNKFLEIIFIKSILEKSYVILYAKLCKDLNKELPQKIEKKIKNKKNKKSSIFRENLLEKCKEMLKLETSKIFDKYIKEKEDQQEKNNKIKKIILGNALFISELINAKMLSKKASCDCIDFLFKKYEENKDTKLKLLNIQSIIIFIEKLGTLIQSEKEKDNNKEIKTKKETNALFEKKISESFKKLEKIKETDKNIPGYVKYSIINLIEKKNNNFKQSEFEKYITAKSKKEIEEETKELKNSIENNKENENKDNENNNELNQDKINILIEKDLYGYKDIIINEGNSDKYLWTITTDLYDIKLKGFDDILEGFFISSSSFIEKIDNIIYAKNYIKELIDYYGKKIIEQKEEKNILNRIIDLFEFIKDSAFETPEIFDIYEYVIYLCIKNGIFKMKDLEFIFKQKENSKDDVNIICKIFQNIFNLIIQNEIDLKNEFKELYFIKEYKELFNIN